MIQYTGEDSFGWILYKEHRRKVQKHLQDENEIWKKYRGPRGSHGTRWEEKEVERLFYWFSEKEIYKGKKNIWDDNPTTLFIKKNFFWRPESTHWKGQSDTRKIDPELSTVQHIFIKR